MPSPRQHAPDENKGASAEIAVSHLMHAQGIGVEISGHHAQLQKRGFANVQTRGSKLWVLVSTFTLELR